MLPPCDLPKDSIREKYTPKNLAIAPNKETAIPILPLSKYNALINPSAPLQKLIDLRTTVNNPNPFAFREKICGEVKPKYTSCAFNSSQMSTALQINFESPYEQQFKLNTQFYNVYLDGKIRAI